jgi:hypothetical protein
MITNLQVGERANLLDLQLVVFARQEPRTVGDVEQVRRKVHSWRVLHLHQLPYFGAVRYSRPLSDKTDFKHYRKFSIHLSTKILNRNIHSVTALRCRGGSLCLPVIP